MSDLARLVTDGISALIQGWFGKIIVSAFVAFVGPMQDGFAALSLLMLIDLFLGVARAHKEGQLSGRQARYKTVIKLMVYWFVVAASHQLAIIIGDDYPLKIAVFYLGTSEFLSVYRNSMSILGRPLLPKALVSELERKIGEGQGDNS